MVRFCVPCCSCPQRPSAGLAAPCLVDCRVTGPLRAPGSHLPFCVGLLHALPGLSVWLVCFSRTKGPQCP